MDNNSQPDANATWFSLKDVSRQLGLKPYQVSYMLEIGKIPEPRRAGGKRIWSAAELEELKAAVGTPEIKAATK